MLHLDLFYAAVYAYAVILMYDVITHMQLSVRRNLLASAVFGTFPFIFMFRAEYIRLGYNRKFNIRIAEALVYTAVDGNYLSGQDGLSLILRLTGFNPFITQILCKTLCPAAGCGYYDYPAAFFLQALKIVGKG